ncbi:MAG: glycosyltransferase [Helicobacteraceae bacterium]|jgi:glycosyltransferase involved in cell wall biosynthesis|nr:glycosyltransferase [Helicobacteraceae bacterium]
MRFFHLINVRWYNATAWYALNLCRLLQEAGHDAIAGVLPNTQTAQKAKEMNIKTYEDNFNAENPIGVAFRLNAFLRDFAPDIVTAHRGELFWFLALKRLFGARWKMLRVRGDQRAPKANFINRFFHNKCADRIIVSGEWIKKNFIEKLKTPRDKISVIYGGVNTTKFAFDKNGRDLVRSEFGLKKSDIVVGLVGRYSEVKGHKSLIDALYILRQNDENYKLLLVTSSSDLNTADLQKYIDDRGLSGAAFITGFRADITACISAFDIGVVASLGSEAICRVAFEIMSVGVPLIAAKVGALPEVTPNGNLFAPNDATAIAQKIKNHNKNVCVFSDEAFLSAYMEAINE